MKKLIPLFAAMLLFAGCANVKVYTDENLTHETGVPMYVTKPYLLVEYNGAKDVALKTSIIYLPDLAKPRYVKFKPGLGSAKLSMAFSNSVLSSYNMESDSKIPDLIGAIGKIPSDLMNAVGGIIKSNADAYTATHPAAVVEQGADKETLQKQEQFIKNELQQFATKYKLPDADPGKKLIATSLQEKLSKHLAELQRLQTVTGTDADAKVLEEQVVDIISEMGKLYYDPTKGKAFKDFNEGLDNFTNGLKAELMELRKPTPAPVVVATSPTSYFELYEIGFDQGKYTFTKVLSSSAKQ